VSEPRPAYDVSLSRCESEGIAGVVVGERGTGLTEKKYRFAYDRMMWHREQMNAWLKTVVYLKWELRRHG